MHASHAPCIPKDGSVDKASTWLTRYLGCCIILQGSGRSPLSPKMASSITANYLSDAVIGSLPKGLTQDQKLKIQQSVPMSPSMGVLKEMKAVRSAGWCFSQSVSLWRDLL